jgi:hypothetical protein
MADPVEAAIAEILRIAGTLNLPVEINYPFPAEADELPLVLVDTGEEEVVEEPGMPPIGWADYWRISPSIEVLVDRVDPMTLHADLTEKWATLRQEIQDSDLLDYIREGTKPELTKMPITLQDKPGIAGFAVIMALEIDRS